MGSLVIFPGAQYATKADLYVVTSADWDKPRMRHTLGYVRGASSVIEEFYSEHNDVRVESIQIQEITKDMLSSKKQATVRCKQLRKELAQLEQKLREEV